MAIEIINYLNLVEKYEDNNICYTASSNVRIDPYDLTFTIPEPDFLCFSKGDYIQVSGTKNNNGIYKKANEVDPYVLEISSYDDPDYTIQTDLQNENLSNILVLFVNLQMGKASTAVKKPRIKGFAKLGVISKYSSSSFPSLIADATATSGAHGRCDLPSVEQESGQASYSTFAFLGLQSLDINVTGCSGFKAVVDIPKIEVDSRAHLDTAHTTNPIEMPSFCVSGDDTASDSYLTNWATGNCELPGIIGGDFSDARAILPEVDVVASTPFRNDGFAVLNEFKAVALSTGNIAYMRTLGIEAQATGASGAQGTMQLPSLEAEVHPGAWGAMGLPSLESTGYDDGWPDSILASGTITLPIVQCKSSSGKHVIGHGSAVLFNINTVVSMKVSGTASQNGDVIANADIQLPGLVASGQIIKHNFGIANIKINRLRLQSDAHIDNVGNCSATIPCINTLGNVELGKILKGDNVIPNIKVNATGKTEVIGNGVSRVEALRVIGNILSTIEDYPILEYNEFGDNWTWQS